MMYDISMTGKFGFQVVRLSRTCVQPCRFTLENNCIVFVIC